ncbi:MAG: pyruvate dehydrogenase complex E1 component subunit beta [Candidatus Omnitrophica bacterium]|nr:pyruvate dehydrogenase complex E1 component subunit beta [Candidatus Omnitrophota bacterium]
MKRKITFAQAILEATGQCMEKDKSVYVMGLGVTDPKGVFGTTLGLKDKYGAERVLDMPVAENGMTGIAIGSALVGMRPIMTHQRLDFMLLSLDQIINNAAKWHYMFGGKMKVPLVIRLLIGRGWGQGPQHSQNLCSIFAGIPGLKVLMPTTPFDAKGLLISAVEDDNPVIFIEHRWLHSVTGVVPEEVYRVPIGKAKVISEGKDITVVSASFMTLEATRAAELLSKDGINSEVIDLRTIRPMDERTILDSIEKTGRLVVIDGAWRSFGIAAEVISLVSEKAHKYLKCAPCRITFPDIPIPTSHALTGDFYPRAIDIINTVRMMFGLPGQSEKEVGICHESPLDVPDKAFAGPF